VPSSVEMVHKKYSLIYFKEFPVGNCCIDPWIKPNILQLNAALKQLFAKKSDSTFSFDAVL
jgi:hypothetical protein